MYIFIYLINRFLYIHIEEYVQYMQECTKHQKKKEKKSKYKIVANSCLGSISSIIVFTKLHEVHAL